MEKNLEERLSFVYSNGLRRECSAWALGKKRGEDTWDGHMYLPRQVRFFGREKILAFYKQITDIQPLISHIFKHDIQSKNPPSEAHPIEGL